MSTHTPSRNRIRDYRLLRGWSQAELARRAGVSRAAISGIEIERLVPSVAIALSLAAVFGVSVETLFGTDPACERESAWAWPIAVEPIAGESCRFWQARVKGRTLCYPVEGTSIGGLAHHGVYRDGVFQLRDGVDPDSTLVIASCDPAAGLLAAEYARITGYRLIVLPRSSREAVSLLGRGVIHAAGVHFSTPNAPDGNSQAVVRSLGAGYRLLRVADWQEGLAVASAAGVSTISSALQVSLRWVGREPGSAARQCLDELRPDHATMAGLAFDHRGVAEAIRCGWADVGVCHQLVAEEAGLRFLPVREEGFDLCYAVALEHDPRIEALLRVIQSRDCRRLFSELPGFDTRNAGEVRLAV